MRLLYIIATAPTRLVPTEPRAMGFCHWSTGVANSEDVTAHEPADVRSTSLVDDLLVDVADHVVHAKGTDATGHAA